MNIRDIVENSKIINKITLRSIESSKQSTCNSIFDLTSIVVNLCFIFEWENYFPKLPLLPFDEYNRYARPAMHIVKRTYIML